MSAYNRTTNQTYNSANGGLDAAIAALAGQNLTGFAQTVIEIDSDQLMGGTTLGTVNNGSGSSFSPIIIRPVNYDPNVTPATPFKLNAQGQDSALAFNGTNGTLGSVRLYGMHVYNYNQNSGNAAGLRYTTVKGQNELKRMLFTKGSIPVRYTTGCGDMLVEDVKALGHGYGAFRFGSPTSNTTKDLGAITFRRVKTRYNRGLISGATLDAAQGDEVATDPANGRTTDDCLVIKAATSLTIEDCADYLGYGFDGVGRSFLGIENIPIVIVRRSLFKQAGLQATTGAVFNYQPGTGGEGPALVVERCVLDNNNCNIIYHNSGTGLKFNQNTVIEPAGLAKNIAYFAGGTGFTEHFGNVYKLNPTSTSVLFNFAAAYTNIAAWQSNYNVYERRTSRAYVGGSGAPSASTLSALQAQGRDVNSQEVNGTNPITFYA